MRKSITAKIQSDRVKDMVRRRAGQMPISDVDRTAPTLSVSPDATGAREMKLAVRTEHHILSPFVLRLNTPIPSPTELLATEDREERILSANLLSGSPISPPHHPTPSLTDAAADLRLGRLDVEGQLVEETVHIIPSRPPQVVPRASAPLIPTPPRPVVHPVIKPVIQPVDLQAHLVLPEPDEEGESESVVLENRTFVPVSETTTEPQPVPEAAKGFSFFQFALPLGWQRAMAAFVLLSFAFVFPLHAMQIVHRLRDARSQLASLGVSAASHLQQGAEAALVRNSADAASSFARASAQFSQAENTVNGLGSITSLILASLPATQKDYRAGTRLIEAGEHLSAAGSRLSEGMIALDNELSPTPASRIKLLSTYAASALPDLEAAYAAAKDIEGEAVPEEARAALHQLQEGLPPVVASLQEFTAFSDMALSVLGANGTKRYLIVFQNNTEIRPTGGFMGSFAEVDVKDGNIVRLDIPGGGTYDLQGSLTRYLAAPEPLRILTPRWEFQDANWFADFPTSARQMLDFYEAAGGPSVDGVIAINATYVGDLIGLIGSIDMPEYGRTITSENFLFEAQKIVELEYDREENTPKAFIGDLAPKLLDRITDADASTFLSVIDRVSAGLVGRDIQVYFTDNTLQRQVLDFGWGGELKQTEGDYLLVVNTNLGGGKTDGVIADTINVSVSIEEDGSIVDTVTVTRSHAGIPGAVFTGVNNVDYVRLYVPKGSELLHAEGFTVPDDSLFETPEPTWEIDEDLTHAQKTGRRDAPSGTDVYHENGKTVFGNWIQTKPGTSSTVQFTYRLPFKLNLLSEQGLLQNVKELIGVPRTETYSLTVQKQSGVIDRVTHVQLFAPETLSLVWSSHDPAQIELSNTTDAMFSALFEQIH